MTTKDDEKTRLKKRALRDQMRMATIEGSAGNLTACKEHLVAALGACNELMGAGAKPTQEALPVG